MLTFLCWKWKSPQAYRSTFGPDSVHVLKRMIERHYHAPHRFVCVTDDTTGLEGIETFRLWDDYANIPNPNGAHNPSCYRRLKVFAPEAGEWFGERLVSMDLDTVIVGDITELFNRPEDFVIWGESDFPKSQWYNGSLWMLRTGTRTKVWTKFNPRHSPRIARKAGARGSDQGWFSYILGPHEATWGRTDGVYSYRKHIAPKGNTLPADAKIVAFHGRVDPWSYVGQQIPFVKENWC